MSDPADLTLAEAARAIVRRDLSPVELVDSCLDRIDLIDDKIRAFVVVDAERARAEATRRSQSEPSGPLHGIPLGIKDLIDVGGLETTASSKVLAGNVAARDAPVVELLRAAGAIVLGKTNTQEFAYGVVTAPTCNPWDLERIPGGSSGGSGAAVAARMCPGALGTDTAGSIRIPASLCGVTGLKPRRRSVPMEGIVPLSWTLDSCGPIAADAASVEVLWRALSGSVTGPLPLRGLRLGTPAWAVTDADGRVIERVETAAAALCQAGARRVEVDLPAFAAWERPGGRFLAAEAVAAHLEAGWYPARADDYTAETLRGLRRGERLSAVEFVAARRELERLAAMYMGALEEIDVLALPATPIAAPPHDEVGVTKAGSFRPEIALVLTRLCRPANFCGLASISVPCGFVDDLLPVGLQLVARDEATAVGAALSFQEITDWHLRRPSSLAGL